MSYRVAEKTPVWQAATRFSATCILLPAVLLHDSLLHHCRLRKIPLEAFRALVLGRGGRVVVVK